MPVSTRSQISGRKSIEPRQSPDRCKTFLQNPHQDLKEKMKSLTLLYEQQKQALALRHHPSIDLLDSSRSTIGGNNQKEVMKNKDPNCFLKMEAKENKEPGISDRFAAYSMPRNVAAAAGAKLRRASMGSVQDGKGLGSKIMVFVRLRPMGKKGEETGSRTCVKIVNKRDVYLTEFASEKDYLRLKRVRGRHFCFDASFPESTSQQEVYSTTTVDLVEGVLQGRNGSVFCYGATGAGKTYTMLGTIEKPGVMVLAIKDLFSKIRQRSFDGNHSVLLSYLEVYNETVRDLLSPGRPLVLREDKQGIIAAGLTQYRAYSTDEVMQLLQQGNQNRTTEPTRVNETSSRSHAILQVVAEYQVRESVNVVTKIGKLSLIDLAGSERALATDLRTQRSIEGANINKSLLSLSSCINALVEGKKHIPYRNSKLTQLLKDSLGGPCNTVMIANISPSILCFSETQNTLHWADRAKEIRNKACIPIEETIKIPESETDQTKLLLELQKQNSELRQQAVRFQQKLLSSQAHILTSTSVQKAPAAPSFPLFSSPCSPNQKSKRSILGSGNCFGTPDSIKRGASNERRTTQEFQKRVKELENEIERLNNENEKLKKEHAVQLKQKDDYIHLLILKRGTKPDEGKVKCRMGKGGSLLKEDLKSPSHRFTSPQPAGKKRSFWDIGYSPSVGAANGRKIRSHVVAPQSPAPSMLLPPGFAWTKQDTASRQ